MISEISFGNYMSCRMCRAGDVIQTAFDVNVSYQKYFLSCETLTFGSKQKGHPVVIDTSAKVSGLVSLLKLSV